jgi:glucans biosynthesis protein
MFMKCSTAICVAWMLEIGAEIERARCGARLRQGGRCPLPPADGKRRCFQHGGARGIGPPKGSQNARRHGFFSSAAIAERRRINDFIRKCLQTLREVDEMAKRER